MKSLNGFQADYVYDDPKTDGLKNVHVSIELRDDYFDLFLTVDDFVSREQLEIILDQLNDSVFRVMRISIVRDCNVILRIKQADDSFKEYNVNVVDSKISVMSVSQFER